MGGAASSGHNNDELIDNLLEVESIKSPNIERVFRAVDRAEYFLPEGRSVAYKDMAWKHGNLHLSAPCIYTEVMEGLNLEPGLSFLNLGSGTGYLSTMAGLILGSNGINHGIEIHDDVVLYANKKLEDFKKHSGAVDEFDFCEPKFIQGNCLCLTSDSHLYDRVYCGAACPGEFEKYMKNLLKVGGILVMPLNEHLLQIRRVSGTSWTKTSLLPVSFASLIEPIKDKQEHVRTLDKQPATLLALSRTVIRNILRALVESELPKLEKTPPKPKPAKKQRALKRFVVPLYEAESSDEEINFAYENRHPEHDYDVYINQILETFRFQRNVLNARNGANVMLGRRQDAEAPAEEDEDEAADMPTDESSDHDAPKTGQNDHSSSTGDADESQNSSSQNDASSSNKTESKDDKNGETSSRKTKAKNKRRKVLTKSKTDESSSDSDCPEENEPSDTTSDDEEENSRRSRRLSKLRTDLNASKWRRMSTNQASSSGSDNENERTETDDNAMRMFQSRYTEPMRSKIKELPLPTILKNYLNYYRDF